MELPVGHRRGRAGAVDSLDPSRVVEVASDAQIHGGVMSTSGVIVSGPADIHEPPLAPSLVRALWPN